MTAPVLPESNINPHFRTPREYCTHAHTVESVQNVCASTRTVIVCVDCGLDTHGTIDA